MTEAIILNKYDIEQRIFTIRGQQVMLDKDLAEIYGVKPIRLREQVKRNIKRFPIDFMFQLTEIEVEFIVSQFAIPSKKFFGGYLPYVFTEQGIAALSSVLNSENAIDVSIQIMRAFVEMRKIFLNNFAILQRIENLEGKQLENNKKFELVFSALEQKQKNASSGIFFDGQVFDAYSFIAELIRTAEKSLILIDNYIDDTVLTLFTKAKPKVSITIYTKTISKQLQLDLEKYNNQYYPISIKLLSQSHDRFLIIDDSELFHIGASLKDLGKKWFAFSKMNIETLKILEKL